MHTRKTYGPAQIYKSLLRFVGDLADAAPHPLIYHAWDSRNDEAELPRADIIGISGWTYNDDQALLSVDMGVTLSTIDDINLMREVDLIDYCWANAGSGMEIPVRDVLTGQDINKLAVTEFRIVPSGQSVIRNYRTMALSMLLTAPAA